ncbi:MAG: serine hydrolase domain-containing protein [Polaribacter sp.]
MKIKSILAVFLIMTFASVYAQKLSTEQLKDSIEKIIKAKKIPGGIITVVSKDTILFSEAYGFADAKNNVKVKENNLFKIASLTKTFTAMAIIRLVKEGKLSLDDELKLIAPEITFINKWESTHPIKIKHLIEHKAGFNDLSYADLARRNQEINYSNSLEKIKSYKNAFISNWKPGLVTYYSNPGFSILGYIIEKKSGKRFEDYIKDEILIPLGMKNSGFIHHFNATQQSLIVNGYTRIDNKTVALKNKNKTDTKSASTGMISNIDDMSKFIQYFLNEELQQNNSIIGVKGVSDMENLHSDFDRKNNIKTGYNLTLEDRVFGEKEFLFKGNSGLTDGFVSNFIYNRELDIGVFASTNLFGRSNRAIIDLVINNYCESKEIQNQYKVIDTDLSKFKNWEGEYRQLNDNQEIWNFINFPVRTKSIKIDGTNLVVSDIEDGNFIYKNVGDNAFLSEEYQEKMPTLYLTEYEEEKSLRFYESTYITTNKTGYNLLRIVLVFSLVILLINIFLFLIKLIVFPFKKAIKPSLLRSLKFATPLLIIVTSVYLGLNNSSFEKISNLGTISITSVTIFIFTILFPIFCIWGVYAYTKEKKKLKKKYNKTFWSLVAFANIFISVYCINMGWFAVRFWI